MNDTFDKARDTRTYNEVKIDFDFGKYNEQIIYTFMPQPKFKLGKNEELGEMAAYEPDCFWRYNGKWIPIDIKFSMSDTSELDFKRHQVDALAGYDGYFLIGNSKRKTLIQAQKIQMFGTQIDAEDSKINKPSYRYLFPEDDWQAWRTPMLFKDKSGNVII